jgi:hypothetical protein
MMFGGNTDMYSHLHQHMPNTFPQTQPQQQQQQSTPLDGNQNINTVSANEQASGSDEELYSMILDVCTQKYNILHDQVQQYGNDTQADNRMAANAQAAESAAAAHENDSGNFNPSTTYFTYTDPNTGSQSQMSLATYANSVLDSSATPSSTTSWSKDDAKTVATALNGKVTAYTDQSSMDQNNMQVAYQKLQEVSQFLATFMSNWHQMVSTVISKE